MTDIPIWITLATMLVSTVGAAVTTLFAYLTTRDKLLYDSKIKEMELRIDLCERDRGEIRDQLKTIKDNHINCEKRADQADDRAVEAELRAARIEGDLAGANRQIDELRRILNSQG